MNTPERCLVCGYPSPSRKDTIGATSDVEVAIILAITLISIVVMILVVAQHQNLKNQVIAACSEQGVVATLDLTEWVPPCITVQQ